MTRRLDPAPPAQREIAPTLDELERRRWHLWAVTALLLVAASVAVLVTLSDGAGVGSVVISPVLPYAFLAVSAAFLLYAFEQERRLRRLNRTVVAQRAQAAELTSRVEDLTTLGRAARTVNSVLAPEEVFEVLLQSAMELSRARSGAVHLRLGEHLVVAVGAGPQGPSAGTRIPVGAGAVGRVAVTGSPEVLNVEGGAAAIYAPLVVRGRTVGVLAVERDPVAHRFSGDEITTVTLFAEHAATAVANANRFEQERSRVEALVDAAEQRAEFVARLVHDLRSPLHAMRGFAALLEERHGPLEAPQRRQAFEGLAEQGQRLERMIEEVLATASLEAGAELRREPVDLAALLTEARDVAVSIARGRDDMREIGLSGLGEVAEVTGDPDALRHVLVNLVENAIKYSPPGSPIDIRAERAGEEVGLHVSDAGRGIPATDLPRIFERFRQAGHSATGGVGLGLYIVRTLVQAHGGRLTVRSEEGQGSEFSVWLPLTEAA